MRKTKLRLEGTYKEPQKQEIQKLLNNLNGVGEVEVDLKGKLVTVHHDPRYQDGSALVKALGKRFKASIEGFTDY